MNPPPHDDVPPASTGPAGGYGPSQVPSLGMNQGMQVLSYLIAGVLAYGFLGWLADHLLGTGFWLPIGIVLGAGLSIYLVIRRFSADPVTGPGATPQATTTKTKGRV